MLRLVCHFYFGSHGCDLPKDHGKIHQCGSRHDDTLCSEFNEDTNQIRQLGYTEDDEEYGWDDWKDYGIKGWYG